MNGLVAWWARNSVAANLLMIVALIGGFFGLTQLEREVFPSADWNGATVAVTWQGASPQDIEDQIVTRLEEALADIDGLKRITSSAREGSGSVNLEVQNGVDNDVFVDEVRQRVNQINNLPQAAFEPQVFPWRSSNTYMRLTIHGNVDRFTLKRVADKVRDDIALLPGGELARVFGTLDLEVSIEISEEALRRYGLTFSEVANAIRRSSLNSSGGSVRTNTGVVSVQARQLADTAEEFGDIIVRQSAQTGTIRVRDVATVTDGFVDANFDSTFNGEPSVFVGIDAPESMDILAYTDAVKKYVEEANKDINIIPEAVGIDILTDDSIVFRGRMSTITNSAGTGLVLVLVVLILFLRPTVALWVTVGIGTAFAGGIMLLPFFGLSWNVLSLFAVLLVIGVIVDDAIVVGENIHKEVESGRRQGLDASVVGTQLVLKPVMFGVITTIIMFSPWMFLSGPERQFTQQISFVVIAALLFSLIESLLILPAHLAHLKPQNFDGKMGWFLLLQRRIADSLLWVANNIYKPVLEAAIKFRYATAALFIAMFMLAQGLVSNDLVPFKFQPEIEDDTIMVTIDMPDGTPFARSEQLRDQLLAGVEAYKTISAREFPGADGDLLRDISIVVTDRSVRAWVALMPPEERPEGISTTMLGEGLREAVGPIPDADDVEFSTTINQGGTGVRFALNHPDLGTLRQAADEVKEKLAEFSNLYDIGDNLSSAAEEINLSLKPGAEALGVRLDDVTTQVRQAYFGELVQRLPRDGEDVEVRVRLDKASRRSLDSLNQMRIRTADGREIPLEEVAEVAFVPGVNRILRRERQRSVTVRARVSGGETAPIYREMEQNFWADFEQRYPGLTRGAIGDAESFGDFMSELVLLAFIALGLMYCLLAIAFGSYSQPLLIMTAIPFGYAGAVFGLLIFDTEMAMFSMFGIGAAAGVVINDNLVLVDYVNRRRNEGAGAVQALVDAGVSRFRPVLLTSVTTFVGILPMIAEKSIQAQFLRPMVVALGGAVAFALFVSLLMVPALYAVGVEIGRVFRWLWGGRPLKSIGEGYEGQANIDEEELIHRGLGGAQPAE